MTVFQYTLEQVMDGSKTRTSRLKKAGELLHMDYPDGNYIKNAKGHVIWQVDKDYAIQPGRGEKQVGRFVVTGLQGYYVLRITEEEVKAEGFAHPVEFLSTWAYMHDRRWYLNAAKSLPIHGHMISPVAYDTFLRWLEDRPIARYDAWGITFAVLP